jgi:hypothetical protein
MKEKTNKLPPKNKAVATDPILEVGISSKELRVFCPPALIQASEINNYFR